MKKALMYNIMTNFNNLSPLSLIKLQRDSLIDFLDYIESDKYLSVAEDINFPEDIREALYEIMINFIKSDGLEKLKSQVYKQIEMYNQAIETLSR